MKKRLILFISLILTAAGAASGLVLWLKPSAISVAYLVASFFSLTVLSGYLFFTRKKNKWYILLFCAVVLVNGGYFMLSVSKTLSLALFANRISYFGSVFLPMSLTMIILNVTHVKYPKHLYLWLTGIGALVFGITATSGFSGIYYKSQQLVFENGTSILLKEYGPLHIIYLFYLLAYFSFMIFAVIRSYRKNKSESYAFAVMLSVAVFINLIVWLTEQFMENTFELLSVSYVICELFLIGLSYIANENKRLQALVKEETNKTQVPEIDEETLTAFKNGLQKLTKTEKIVFDCYVAGKSSKEVMAELVITENTLKFHNRNIYGKLGVPSRKRLIEIYSYYDHTN